MLIGPQQREGQKVLKMTERRAIRRAVPSCALEERLVDPWVEQLQGGRTSYLDLLTAKRNLFDSDWRYSKRAAIS